MAVREIILGTPPPPKKKKKKKIPNLIRSKKLIVVAQIWRHDFSLVALGYFYIGDLFRIKQHIFTFGATVVFFFFLDRGEDNTAFCQRCTLESALSRYQGHAT